MIAPYSTHPDSAELLTQFRTDDSTQLPRGIDARERETYQWAAMHACPHPTPRRSISASLALLLRLPTLPWS